MDNLMNCQLQCQKCEQNVFFTHYVNEAVISHGVKKWYFASCVSPGSAETNAGWGGKLNAHLTASCVWDIRTKKLSESDNWCSSYSRKCRGCFLGQCRREKE